MIGCAVRENPKVPEIEQVIAVGAAAQNLFSPPTIWAMASCGKPGAAAYDPDVKSVIGLQGT